MVATATATNISEGKARPSITVMILDLLCTAAAITFAVLLFLEFTETS